MDLAPVATVDELGEEWDALALASGNVFATREWLATWWRHFGGDRSLAVTAHRHPDGRLAVVLPLYGVAAQPLRTLRFLGHGPGDWLGPIHAPGDVELAGAALRAAVDARADEFDVLLAEQVPRAAGLGDRVGGRPLLREGFPSLALEGRSWEDVLASRSANFRQQVRRRERRLRREQDVTFRLADDPARLESDLTSLFELHDRRWGETTEGAFPPPRERFHRDFARLALARGWLRLWLAEAGDRAVAAWYGFRFAGAEWYYQAGRDPRWDHLSVGAVLLGHTVRAAVEDGCRAYLFLRGHEEYKYRWADTDPGLETFAVPLGARGRAATASVQVLRSLPEGLRRPAQQLAARAARFRH